MDQKISELTADTPVSADVFVFVDDDGGDTNKVTLSNLTTAIISEGSLITASTTDTLTNKTIDLTDNTLTGTLAEFNTALSDDNLATLGAANAFTVGGHTITVADTANVVGLTINQNDVTNLPVALHLISAHDGFISRLETTHSGSVGPLIDFYHNSASPAAVDTLGGLEFYGEDSASNKQLYGAIYAVLDDPTSTSEDGSLHFFTTLAGTSAGRLQVGNGINGIHVGATTAAGILSSNGNQDLILQTGNATTGSITITDGANGDIDLIANGSGVVGIGNTTTGTVLRAASGGEVGISVGEGSSQGVVESFSDTDLVLKTGNATTGTITITDGADGDITLAPNGSGAVVLDGVEVSNGGIGNGSDGLSTIQFSNASNNIIYGTAGTEILILNQVTTAVNEFTITNAATGNGPQLEATGNDTDIDIELIPKGTGIVKGELKRFAVRLKDSTTSLTTGTTVGGDYRISNRAITIKAVGAYVDTAAATGTTKLTVDINEAGTTIMTTNKITIDVGEKSSETAATAPAVTDTAIAADAIITFDIDAVNETTPATGLVCWIDYTYA